MEWIYQLNFIERGVIAGVIIALICPIIGAFLLVRRVSIISESLSHITLTGISAGALLGGTSIWFADLNPMYMGVVFALVGSLLIEKLRQVYPHFQELAIPIILSSGIGLSAIFISLSTNSTQEWYAYLFGSIVSVTAADLHFIILAAMSILLIVVLFYKEFISISFDLEHAKVSGVSVKLSNFIFSVLVALVISISMKVVGILLVGALIVIPVATSIQFTKSFKQLMAYGILFAQAAVFSGIYFAYHFQLATGGTIVVSALVILLVVLFITKQKSAVKVHR
ncbi:metal ABC transporter permease [Alkalihalobacillus alcalophilus ATCC 27647 = CGMCC 1.3604]|nr:metal ABC transporter permease [Alkalihalobacillus alcalophilus]KGA95914.1 metal ABC transporter permease [Alkalihalobacillus alcalophilus ATCC 27647 = CGMCC 1.3604]MED1563709.1 metal ABC transporter permease [Alkalihalobacillus alcalophilus]THG89697.1 metal ABC transporter permease [Alkalihalobacillus alcalophilus ATCC 27647 = CGMCC 1.3604]